jgi:hypothetical protein
LELEDLDKAGLGEFCLPLHSGGARPKAVIEALKQRCELAMLGASRGPDPAGDIERAKTELKAHLQVVHAPTDLAGETVHRQIGRIVAISHRFPDMPQLLAAQASCLPGVLDGARINEARRRLRALEKARSESDGQGIAPLASVWRSLQRTELSLEERHSLQQALEDLQQVLGRAHGDLALLAGEWVDESASLRALRDFMETVNDLSDPPRHIGGDG